MARSKNIPLIIVLTITGLYISYRIISYFTHTKNPSIAIVGMYRGDHYKGVVNASIQADSSYKINRVCALVDGNRQATILDTSIGKASFDVSLQIDTTVLEDGKHELVVNAIDSSYNQNKTQVSLSFFVDNRELEAQFIEPAYNVLQGRTVHALVKTSKPVSSVVVSSLGQSFEAYPVDASAMMYEAFIPTDCEVSAQGYPLQASIVDFVGNTATIENNLAITSCTFPKQKGFKVTQGKLEEEKELSINTRVLEDALSKWLVDSPKKKMWQGPFIMPCEVQRISTPFGELRMTAEKGRYYHKAIDIVNHPRSVVWAAQDGRVIIKDRFLFPGNVVVLDHGLGVFTLYYHLDDFADIQVGDLVKKGSPIGRLGKTGYAAGYHLHWELRVQNVAVDPLQWVEHTF